MDGIRHLIEASMPMPRLVGYSDVLLVGDKSISLIDFGFGGSLWLPRETQTCDSDEHNCDAYQSQPMSRFSEQ